MKNIVVSVLLMCATVAWGSPAHSQSVRPQSKAKTTCSLPYVLWDLGKKHDIHFTIEALDPVIVTGSMEWEFVLGIRSKYCNYLQEGVDDVNQELQALQRDLPNLGYIVDGGNPRIIHVYDKRLVGQQAYPLGKTLGTFQFSGTEAELVHALYKTGLHISFRSDGVDDGRDSAHDPLAVEAQRAQVDFNNGAASVRELLSAYQPPHGEDRLLWISSVILTKATPSTVVIHFGYRREKGWIISR